MFKEEAIDYVEELFTKPLFRKWFFEFFSKMQQEGIDAARHFWNLYHKGSGLIPKAPEIFERLIDFYIILGFVPRRTHDETLTELEKMREENRFLRDTIKELRNSIVATGGKPVQEAWQLIIDKQIEMNKGMAKGFLDFGTKSG